MTINQYSLLKARENYYRFIMHKSNFTINKSREFRNEILKFITYFKQITPFAIGACYNIIESNKVTVALTNLMLKNKNLSLEYSIRLKYMKEDFKSGKNMFEYCSRRYLDQEKLDLLWLHWGYLSFTFQSNNRWTYRLCDFCDDKR